MKNNKIFNSKLKKRLLKKNKKYHYLWIIHMNSNKNKKKINLKPKASNN